MKIHSRASHVSIDQTWRCMAALFVDETSAYRYDQTPHALHAAELKKAAVWLEETTNAIYGCVFRFVKW